MNLALFDFDGTITFADSFRPFLFIAIDPVRRAIGRVALIPIIIGYQLGLISASKTRASIVAFGFRGRREADVRQAGAKYAHDVLPGTIRKKALERIKWHQAQGDVVVVVSAALDVYLVEWCRLMELGVICTELESTQGVLTGSYRNGDCVREEKTRRIRAQYRLEDYETIYAYGDTSEDAEMLSLANRRFFRWEEITGQVPRGRKADHVDQDPNR